MDKELQTTESNLVAPSKKLIYDFVKDSMDMEVRKYTLEQTAEAARQKASEMQDIAERNLWRDVTFRDSTKKVYEDKKVRSNYTYMDYCKNSLHFGHFIGWFFFFLASALPCGILIGSSQIIIGLIFGIVGALIFFVLRPIVKISKYKKEYQRRQNNLQEALNNYNEAHSKYEKTAEEHEKALKAAKTLCNHADELAQSAKVIGEALTKHYSIGIIPIDYQNMQCVIYIDRVFRNDQVDTMREATLLCDKEVHHGETMAVLYDLAASMRGIKDALDSIKFNVSVMSQELFRISDNQEILLSETQSMRYATESIKQSSDNADFYIAQRRAGIL